MADYESMSSGSKNAVEAELQDFLMMEKQRMQVTQQVRQHNPRSGRPKSNVNII